MQILKCKILPLSDVAFILASNFIPRNLLILIDKAELTARNCQVSSSRNHIYQSINVYKILLYIITFASLSYKYLVLSIRLTFFLLYHSFLESWKESPLHERQQVVRNKRDWDSPTSPSIAGHRRRSAFKIVSFRETARSSCRLPAVQRERGKSDEVRC